MSACGQHLSHWTNSSPDTKTLPLCVCVCLSPVIISSPVDRWAELGVSPLLCQSFCLHKVQSSAVCDVVNSSLGWSHSLLPAFHWRNYLLQTRHRVSLRVLLSLLLLLAMCEDCVKTVINHKPTIRFLLTLSCHRCMSSRQKTIVTLNVTDDVTDSTVT